MKETCRQCGNKFDSKRSTALYCSGACRALAGRGWEKKKDEIILNAVSARDSAQPDPARALTMHERQCESNNEVRSVKHTVNTGAWKSFGDLDKGESNRVPLPGDGDYVGVVTEEMLV